MTRNRVVVTQVAMRRLFREPAMQTALDVTVEALADEIRNQSPVETGQFQDSIRTRRYPLSRRAYSVDQFAHIVEYAGANVIGPGGGPPIAYAPFRRAVRFLGLTFDEVPKPVNE